MSVVIGKEKNSAGKEWLKRVNPLEGLSITQAKNVYNYSRAHGSPLLQKIYDEIEMTDPVLMTCVERRQSALSGLGWRALADSSAADPEKAEAQRQAIERFAAGIVNLEEAIEHLDLAFFRGYSVVQPIWENGGVSRISILDSWNFLKGDDGNLLWNPSCTLDVKDCTPITPAARCVILMRRRAIDWPALSIFIRKYLGERDWGRFIERYGIPPVDVVMAPNATDKNRAEYEDCGEAAKDGRTVAWPSGTNVSRAEGARGTDPFTAFIEHQEKLIVLMATGGTLTSLAQADTGSLAGGAQMDVWTQIVKRDGVLIGAALDRDLFAPYLREKFPGEPIMAHFELGAEEEPSANETAELAGKLKLAGYLVDQSELEEQVGMKLVKDETPAQGAFPALNKILNKASKDRDARPSVDEQHPDLLAAFAADTSPIGEAVKELLKDPSPEAAKALLGRLPSLLPDDPAMAAVLAEAMAAEFGDQLVKNKEGVCTSPNGPAGCKSPTCPGAKDLSNLKDDQGEGLNEAQKASLIQGHASIEKVLQEQIDVMDAMNDPELGTIDFRWDANGFGIKHIIARRNAYKDARDPNAISGEDMVRMIPSVIARGDRTFVGKGLRRDVEIDFKGLHVVLTPSLRGKEVNHWVMTGYDINPKAAGYRK